MISHKEALDIILNKNSKLKTEKRNISDCLNRVLAKDMISKINVPGFDNSAMDGFAISAGDLENSNPIKVIAETKAGQASQNLIKKGCAISIMTGAPIPKNTAAVVPIENVKYSEQRSANSGQRLADSSQLSAKSSGKQKDEIIEIIKKVKFGENIRRAGEDISKGERLIEKHTHLKPIHIALAASAGVSVMDVYRKPKVAIVVTGDEIIKPGNKLSKGQIYESNSFLLNALLEVNYFEVVYSSKAKDKLAATVQVLKKAIDKADIILTAGGISVGKFDFVSRALKEIGAKNHISSVAQKPGKPLSYFMYKDKSIICLPGNPVAVGICFEVYVRPLLLKLAGSKNIFRNTFEVQMENDFKKKKGRLNFIRVNVKSKNGINYATTTGSQGSGILSSMIADAIAIMPASVDLVKKGQKIKALDLQNDYN